MRHPQRAGRRRWRHLLWFVALAVFVVLYFVVPATRSSPHETLTYSQLLSSVAAKHVKTVNISSDGKATGKLANGHGYSTVIPLPAGSSAELRSRSTKS